MRKTRTWMHTCTHTPTQSHLESTVTEVGVVRGEEVREAVNHKGELGKLAHVLGGVTGDDLLELGDLDSKSEMIAAAVNDTSP